MQSTTLQAGIGGINRLRRRANVQPTDLYDLVNAYRQTGVYRKRQGLKFVAALDSTTFGLYGAQGKLHCFTSNASVPAAPSGVAYHILPNPNGTSATINGAPFAGLFLGQLYIAALFTDGTCVHYWLGQAVTWKPGTQYQTNAIVQPTVPNGFQYVVGNNQFPAAWQPNQTYAVGDVVVPSTLNGWQYTCITANGTNPASGTTEPTWPASNGATVTEDTTVTTVQPQPPAAPPSNPGGTRYGNMGGGFRSGSGIAP